MKAIEGVLVPFDVEVERWWGSLVFEAGCFDEWLAEDRQMGRTAVWVAAGHQMEPLALLADEQDSSLVLTADDKALHFIAEIPEFGDEPGPSAAQLSFLALRGQGKLACVSAGTPLNDVEWQNLDDDDKDDLAIVKRAGIYEMSTVLHPAFTQATITNSAVGSAAVFGYINPKPDAVTLPTMSVELAADSNGQPVISDGRPVGFDFEASRAAAREQLKQQADAHSAPTETVEELRERLRSRQ